MIEEKVGFYRKKKIELRERLVIRVWCRFVNVFFLLLLK
jgi:hypothetical protein